MKTVLKILLLASVTCYLVFAVAKFAKPSEEQICTALDIYTSDSLSNEIVTEDYVCKVLYKHKVRTEGQKISDINLQDIERILAEDPYIKSASCYHTGSSHMCINVIPEYPILHIITRDDNYYLDNSGLAMPIGNFNIDLCVATGNITKKFAKDHLIGLASYIREDEFWNSQIEQIHVVDSCHIELFPRVGNHTILLGSSDNYAEKLERMRIFYKKGLAKVGWNKYKTIDLSFDGQIVCKKKQTTKK